MDAVVEHNRSALPHLLPGKNVVKVSAPKDVSVTYGYPEATAPERRSRWDAQGVATSAPKTATHEGSSPAWTIDVGGNSPPKMLYLEISARGK